MRRIILRFVAVMLVAVMLLAAVAGCKKKESKGSLYVPPEFVFVAESLQLPTEIGNLRNLVYFGDKVYFTADTYEYDEARLMQTYAATIYSMNIDGTGVTPLPNYTPPGPKQQDLSGGFGINNMQIDTQGNLWVNENWNYYGYDLPDGFDPDTDEAWNYYTDHGSGVSMRKLDLSGAELLTLDTAPLQGSSEWFYISAQGIDGAGNLYISTDNYEEGGMRIHVLDSNGSKLFHVDTESWFNQFILLPDGTIAFSSDTYDASGNWSRGLQTIDFAAKALGAAISIPNVGWEIMPGSGDYDILIGDGNNLWGYTLEQQSEEPVKLLNWLESDILYNDIQNITMLSDDVIICTNSSYNRAAQEITYELLVLTKTPYSELPEKTVLTLAAFYVGSNLREAVVLFNRTNPNYRIHIIDYSEFSTDTEWDAGLTRLSTEIISGVVPDILDVSSLPYKEYAARGLLTDIYTMIDADPTLNRNDFVQGAFRAAELDGSLYQVFPSFYVTTMVGNPNVLGPEPGWTMDEFSAVLAAHPEADMPLGMWLTRMNMLQGAVSFAMDDYIDWAAGTVHFDTPQFIQLLELCTRFPDEIDYSDDNWVSSDEAIAQGRQIMMQTSVSGFTDTMWNKMMFDGEVVYKGFPNESRAGNSLSAESSLALIETSPNKDAAWSFIRTILDEPWQSAYIYWGFPTNQASFDKKAQAALEEDYSHWGMSYDGGRSMQGTNVTQSDIDQIVALINSTSNIGSWNVDTEIWNIISESAADFFNGTTTAADAARIIQSRVSILVSERS